MRTPKKQSFSQSRVNSKYKIKNWSSYNDYLRKRGRILAHTTTHHTSDDRSQVEGLLTQVKIKALLGDPGYDGENIYQLQKSKGIKPTIRPPNTSHIIKFNGDKTDREEENMSQEMIIKCTLLKRMKEIGMPIYMRAC